MGDEVVNDIAVDSKGNVVFVGSINSSSNFADNCPALMTGSCPLNTLGGMDVFVVKVDPSGIPLWTIVAGDPNPTQEARSVAFGPNDAVFIAGNYDGKIAFPGGTILENPTLTTSNIFVAKYNADGTHGWSKGFGDEFKQVVGGIAVDSTGDVVVTGYFTNSIDFGCLDGMMMPNLLTSTGSNDIFVVKFRGTDGSCVWNRSFGDPKDQRAAAVDIDKNNDAIYFTGRCAGVFPVNSMMPTLDCGQSGMDVIVGKLDSMGEPIWGIRFGDTADQEGTSIAVAPDGKIAVTGRFFGTLDFGGGMSATAPGVFEDAFVVQLDSTGLATWARWFSSTGKQAGTSVAIGDNGQVFVAGEMTGSVQFGLKLLSATGTDAFVLAYDSLGNTICGNNYGDTDAQSGVAIASINTNEIVAGLNYQGTVDLDYTAQCLAPAPSATFQDALVGKFTLKP
ncbi:MAG: hypothetical protein IPM54_19380 [Polyangiaceae bacterium]|nr:hypothetical protein [Polyangiaceae bacterium]